MYRYILQRNHGETESENTGKIPGGHFHYNIDGSTNTAGKITHCAVTEIMIPDNRGHISTSTMVITDIDDQDLILGIDWLKKHNPHINWIQGTIKLDCCGSYNHPIKVHREQRNINQQ